MYHLITLFLLALLALLSLAIWMVWENNKMIKAQGKWPKVTNRKRGPITETRGAFYRLDKALGRFGYHHSSKNK